jgi:hypothetical protein
MALCNLPRIKPILKRPTTQIRIATGLVELSSESIVSTTLYNGQFPGPLLRLAEGKRVVVDIYNDTDTPEQLHWHGQFVPVDVDGAAEEGTPYIPAHGMRRIAFVPKPSGFRFYHSHVVPKNNLGLGTYTGQAGPIYIEPANNSGTYDREVFLVFLPSFSQGGDMAMDFLEGDPIEELQTIGKSADEQFAGPKGYEVSYDLFGINGKILGHGEPIRVSKASAFFSMCSTPAPVKSAAWRCLAILSGSWHWTAIQYPYRLLCRCYGSAPPNVFQRL